MRAARQVVALAVALGLAVGGVLVAVEIVLAESGRSPWVLPHDGWYAAGSRNSWDDAAARWAFAGLTLGGLGLLVLAATPRRPEALPMTPGRHPAIVDRRSAEKAIVGDVGRLDGVSKVRARIGRRSTEVVATTNRRVPGDLRDRVVAAVDGRLRRLALTEVPAVHVRLRQSRQR